MTENLETDLMLVRLSTGEIVTNNVSKWYTPTQEKIIQDYYKKIERREKLQKSDVQFVMCFITPIQSMLHELNLVDCGVIMKLLPYLAMNNDGLLVKSKRTPLTFADIVSIVGLSDRQTHRILPKLKKFGILDFEKEKNNPYSFNEKFHKRGGKNNKNFVKLLLNDFSKYCSQLKLNELGFLYKCMTFINYKTHVLCSFPNEEDKKKMNPLSKKDLVRLTRCNKDTVTTLVESLEKHRLLASLPWKNRLIYFMFSNIFLRLEDVEGELDIHYANERVKLASSIKKNKANNNSDPFLSLLLPERDEF